MPESVDITELIEIDPTRVDAVGSPANGTDWLILKAIGSEVTETEATLEDVLAEIGKAADDKPDACPLCKGDKTIKGGNVKCPKCKGTGVAPKVGMSEKELLETVKATAPSGAPVPPANVCPTCQGNGKIVNAKQGATEATDDCPDCGGSGKDAHSPEDNALNTMSAPGGGVQVGDSRETVDKAIEEYDEMVKAKYKQADRDQMASSGQAMSDGSYPVADAEDLDRAIHAVGRGGADHDKIRAHIISRAKALGASSKIPDNWNADGSMGKGVIEKDGIVSGPNPFMNGSTNSSTTDPNASDQSATSPVPGSPDWEAADAEIAANAAQALLTAAELIRQFADREAIEVAAGEGNDVFDTWDAEMALDAVTAAVGVMATLAFHEGVAAQKSEGVAEKSGKRLSTKSVTALAAARDHLNKLLGDDDPAKASDDDDATKSQKDILDMNADELKELVKETVVEAVSVAKADMQDVDHKDSIANAKMANGKAKKKNPKADMPALEDEAGQGDDDSASSPANGAAKEKRELTPEEIEARDARKAAKKELKKAKREEKQAAKTAELTKAIEEATAEVRTANAALQDRLATVEKMAAPGAPAKARPQEAVAKAAERDAAEIEIARLERVAKETTDQDVRRGNLERAKELRAKISENV